MARFPYGPDGAGPLRRALRRSLIRTARKITWDHRGLQPVDTFVASYPRAGSLWLRFMILSAYRGRETTPLEVLTMTPYVGMHHQAPALLPTGGRLIKTHEPYHHQYKRAVHLVRDPRDVAVSYYSLLQKVGFMAIPKELDPADAFDRYLDAFIAGRLDSYGTWQQHSLSWAKAGQHSDAEVLTVRYEDLRADSQGELGRVLAWLGIEASNNVIADAVSKNSIERMRAGVSDIRMPNGRLASLTFINEGLVGKWRGALTERQERKFAAFDEGLELFGYRSASDGNDR